MIDDRWYMIICRSRFKSLKQYLIFILTLNRLSWGTLYDFPQFVFISFLIRNVMLSRLNTSTPSVNTLNEICRSQLTIHEGKRKKKSIIQQLTTCSIIESTMFCSPCSFSVKWVCLDCTIIESTNIMLRMLIFVSKKNIFSASKCAENIMATDLPQEAPLKKGLVWISNKKQL